MAAGEISGRVRSGAGSLPHLAALLLPLLTCVLPLAACSAGAGGPAQGGDGAQDRLVGAWHAEFTPANAHESFTLRVQPHDGLLSAVIERAGEEIPVSSIDRRDLVVTILIAQPEAEIFAKMAPNGGSMSGFWRQQLDGTVSELPFKAWRMDPGEGE